MTSPRISLTSEQRESAKRILAFLQDPALEVFILAGYAGTGKTHLIRWVGDELEHADWTPLFLAPTGRAARILASRTGRPATTLHSAIYNLSRIEELEPGDVESGVKARFGLRDNDLCSPFFVVDEASMVADHYQDSDTLLFGSGYLLSDLLTFARRGRGRFKILFVGDPAQLPPVGASFSPALSKEHLAAEKGLTADSWTMKEVVRQRADSAVLENATRIRISLEKGVFSELDIVPHRREVMEIPAAEMVSRYLEVVREHGFSRASILVGGNRGALDYNLAVRGALWGEPECPARPGDLLLINQNNLKTGLMNGDLVRVVETDAEAETVRVPLRGRGAVDLRFRDLRLRFRNAEGLVVEQVCKALDNLLFSPSRSLSAEEQTALYVHFRQRYPRLSPRDPAFSLVLRDDPYFQALRVKFGYALTCHKAQGGEWEEVFVYFDQHRGHRNADFFRWAYTAITRARSRLTVVNAPHFNAVTGVRVADLDRPEEPRPLPLPTAPLEAETGDAGADVGAEMVRLGFPAGREHLRALFRAVYGRAVAGGVRMLEVVHGQYHERYRLGVDDQVLQFQVYYDGANRFTRIVPVGGPAEGDAFERVHGLLSAAMQIANMHGELERGEEDRQSWPSALLDLVRLFEPELERRGISLVRREAMSWRERLWFGRGAESAGFDFVYNSLGQWTNIQPVRRKGSSNALASELAEVLARLG